MRICFEKLYSCFLKQIETQDTSIYKCPIVVWTVGGNYTGNELMVYVMTVADPPMDLSWPTKYPLRTKHVENKIK